MHLRRYLLFALLIAAVAATMLVPAGAGAQRTPPICQRHPEASICKAIEKRTERKQNTRGVSTACRVATSRATAATTANRRAKAGVAKANKALKNAKGKKAKAKKAKAVKRAKAKAKKTKTAVSTTGAAKKKACA